MQFTNEKNALVIRNNGELVRIEAWGRNALRVRSTMLGRINENDWALTEKVESAEPKIEFFEREYAGDGWGRNMQKYASITNGRIRAEVNFVGIISFFRDDKLILREYFRSYGGTISRESRCL